MPVDPNQQAQNAITLIERYGSFGLLCVIVLGFLIGGGVFLWYFVARFMPKVMAWLDARDDAHAKQLDDRDKAHAEQLEKRDAICKAAAEASARAAEQVKVNTQAQAAGTQAVSDLVAEVSRLKNEYRPPRERD